MGSLSQAPGWGSRSPKGSSIPGTTRTQILTGQENENLNGSPSLELLSTPERGLCRTEMFGGTRQPKRRRRRKRKTGNGGRKKRNPRMMNRSKFRLQSTEFAESAR